MPRRLAYLFGLLLIGGIEPAAAQTVVSGKLLGAGGEALPAAHVEVYTFFRRQQVPRLIPAEQGRYRLEIKDTGVARLRFLGPLHRIHEVVVLVEGQPTIDLDVQLQRTWMDSDQSFTHVATSYTNFDYNEGVPLVEQADGSYTAVVDVPGDSLVYTLPGMTSSSYEGLILESITADRFIYSRREGYLAVAAAEEGQVRVTVRPERLTTEEALPPVVTFGAANQRAATLWDVYQRMRDDGLSRLSRSMRAGQAVPSSKVDADRENMFRQEMLALEIEIAREADPFRKQLLLMLYLQHSSGLPYWTWSGGYYRSGVNISFGANSESQRDFAMRIIEEIPPTSLIWTLHVALFQVLIETSGVSEDVVAYVERVIDEHPVVEVRQFALFNLIDGFYARRGLSPDVVGYIEKYGDMGNDELPSYSLPLQKDLKVVVGRRAPEFRSMPWEGKETVSSDSLKGQVVLLNFWTPWCGECNADLDNLQTLHETYGDDGLEIVRVSLEYGASSAQDAEAVPWLFYQGEDGFKSRIAISFEVLTLPHRVLIDRDGVILAVGADLFGDRLVETLHGVFNE